MSNSSPSPEPTVEVGAATPRPRQLRLFQVANPILGRVGHEVFTSLPSCPGVYFFYDASGKLLYIGQSLNLRARVTSYRHVSPERHPRRILRLVHRIARIEWQICDTPEAAIELERVLLLQHRPPFNRAGTWQAPPWYLHIAASHDELQLTLRRDSSGSSTLHSWLLDITSARQETTSHEMEPPVPFPVTRPIHATLCRCLMRLHRPDLPVSQYPAGLLNFTAPLELRLPFPGQATGIAQRLREFFSGASGTLLDSLKQLQKETTPIDALNEEAANTDAEADPCSMMSYWCAQVETLQIFAAKLATVTGRQE